MPTQRSDRIDELTLWARPRIRNGRVDAKTLEMIIDEAQRHWNVTRGKALDYAENVLVKLQPNESYWRLDAATIENMRRILMGNP